LNENISFMAYVAVLDIITNKTSIKKITFLYCGHNWYKISFFKLVMALKSIKNGTFCTYCTFASI